MALTDDQATLEDITFPRREKAGIVLGLDLAGMISIFLCLVLMIVAVMLVPFPWGVAVALLLLAPAGLLGWGRFKGRRIFGWERLLRTHWLRELTRQNLYARPAPVADAAAEARMAKEAEKMDERAEREALEWEEPVPGRTPKPTHLHLPGGANELKAYETPGGYGMVHDPARKRVVVTARMNTRSSYTLQDDSQQAAILDDWGNLLAVVCQNPAVVGAVGTDVTTVTTGEQMQEFYRSSARAAGAGEELNPVAHQGYLDLLAESDMTHHPQYLTISLSIPMLKTEIKHHGSGMNGLLGAVEARMVALEKDIEDNNFHVDQWVRCEDRAGLLHDMFSPSPIGVVNGLQVTHGGPVGARRYWDKLRADAHWHRAFVIEEWPLKPTRPGFLEKVILDLKFRHAVSVVHKAGDDEAAMRQVNRQIQDTQMQHNVSDRSGRRVSLEMTREFQDHLDREEELVSGATDMQFRGFISITADSEDDLDRCSSQLRSAAARAHLKVEPCYGQQFEGFLAATGLLGFGID